MNKHLYADYILNLAKRFDEALSEMEAHHNFELGAEFEIAICNVLRRALPHQYGICRGYLVDREGTHAGDDIIIYDRMRSPTLRALGAEDYSRKERVPIEAVYAFIEAKHGLNLIDDDSSLSHACQQLAKVRDLCGKRAPVNTREIGGVTAMSILLSSTPEGYPEIRNPMYGVVLARKVRERKGEPFLDDPSIIARMMVERCSLGDNPPDLVVAGISNVTVPFRMREDRRQELVSPFFVPGVSASIVHTAPQRAFGIGLTLLLWALDWIRLGAMSWPPLVVDGLGLKIIDPK